MKIKFVSNDTGARFVVRESIPIGLNGDSQRSMHTNLVGRLMEGCFKVGENVSVPLKDGNTKSVQLIGISVPADWAHAHKSSKFPESITADPAKDITIALSVRIRPHDADTVLAQIVGPQLKYNEIPSRFARRNASALLPGEKLRHRRGVIAAQRVGYELKVVMGVPFVRIGAGELAKQRWPIDARKLPPEFSHVRFTQPHLLVLADFIGDRFAFRTGGDRKGHRHVRHRSRRGALH